MCRRHFLLAIASISLILLIGCRKDTIETYDVPKEISVSMTAGMPGDLGGPDASTRDIEWKVPAGWQEQNPSDMRLGSFLIKGANGQAADMSVIPLAGDAGGDLANVNRWRGQIQLSPLTAADLSAQSETIAPGGRRMIYVNFVGGKKRLLAAIYHRNGRTWFFKMLGEDQTVLESKRAFMQFLKSLKFHEN
jgi:hypothetical protein